MAYAQRFETGAAGHLMDDETIELAVRASVPPTTMTMAAARPDSAVAGRQE